MTSNNRFISNSILKNFDDEFKKILSSEVEFIQIIAQDLSEAGGKRLRAFINLTIAKIIGMNINSQDAKNLAICIELLHSASLLHDDLIDNSETRRGKETAFKKFGNVVSVMSGDFMLSKILILLADLPNSENLVKNFGLTASQICEGEVLQFQMAAYGDYSYDKYLKIIEGKTAKLFELAAKSPSIMQGKNQDNWTKFGYHFGIAFQMRDDYFDLFGDKTILGKEAGSDLKEGKITLATIFIHEEIEEIINRKASLENDFNTVKNLAKKHEEKIKNIINEEFKKAEEYLNKENTNNNKDFQDLYKLIEQLKI